MSKFFKYPSITAQHIEEFIDKIKKLPIANSPWVVTEKIHGSNTQLSYDGTEFKFGRRVDFIEDDKDMFNAKKVLEQYKGVLKEFYDTMYSRYGVSSVIMYGEVYGGSYPHPDVTPDRKAERVNKGVFYAPSNHWACFDLAYTIDDERYFLSPVELIDWCTANSVPYVPVLKFCKSFDEALAYPNDLPSVVYRSHNLPELEDNIMEGTVIRPSENNAYIGFDRVIVKNKNEKYFERSRKLKVNIQIDVPEEVKKAIALVSEYITENRIRNVLSHYGKVSLDNKTFGLLQKEIYDDIMTDFNKEQTILNTLEKREVRDVNKYIQRTVACELSRILKGN